MRISWKRRGIVNSIISRENKSINLQYWGKYQSIYGIGIICKFLIIKLHMYRAAPSNLKIIRKIEKHYSLIKKRFKRYCCESAMPLEIGKWSLNIIFTFLFTSLQFKVLLLLHVSFKCTNVHYLKTSFLYCIYIFYLKSSFLCCTIKLLKSVIIIQYSFTRKKMNGIQSLSDFKNSCITISTRSIYQSVSNLHVDFR